MTNSTVEDDALGITHTNAILSFKPIALEANGAANILDWTMIFTYFTVLPSRFPTGFCDTVTSTFTIQLLPVYACTYLCPTYTYSANIVYN